jgi:rubrerythrin
MRHQVQLIFHEGSRAPRPLALEVARGVPNRLTFELVPALSPRDEAIFLLHTAAEIEHALMVQYLYAAWSLPESGSSRVERWRRDILQIAREEMAHFAAVQNLLRFIGGPLNFDREDFPYRSEFYPFPFQLEPLGRESLARYIAAEMPARTEVDPVLIAEVLQLAGGSEGRQVNRVGALYSRLIDVFGTLPDTAFRPATAGSIQAPPERWRADLGRGPLFLRPVATREEALSLLTDVARQGEGEEDMPDSHFLAFVEIFDAWPKDAGRQSLAVALHPNTRSEGAAEGALALGHITHPRTLQWAQVFNHHYRMLLSWLQQALFTPVVDPASQGLSLRTFAEMLALADVGRLLTTLPLTEDPEAGRAGAPFELPYSMALPDLPAERWAYHRELLGTARAQLEALSPEAPPAEQPLLRGLFASLHAAEAFVEAQSLSPAVTERGP